MLCILLLIIIPSWLSTTLELSLILLSANWYYVRSINCIDMLCTTSSDTLLHASVNYFVVYGWNISVWHVWVNTYVFYVVFHRYERLQITFDMFRARASQKPCGFTRMDLWPIWFPTLSTLLGRILNLHSFFRYSISICRSRHPWKFPWQARSGLQCV